MKLLTTVAATTGLFSALALAKDPNIDKMVDVSYTPDNEGETQCMAPKNPRAINTKRNFIVKCKGKNWEVEERCRARQPCVDPDLGSPRCWNDFDVEWDECPKGQVCEDKNGNFFEGYLYKPDD